MGAAQAKLSEQPEIIDLLRVLEQHKLAKERQIQLRTIAMEFWATLEHQLRYKKNWNHVENMQKQLKQCAELVTTADYEMQQLAD